MHQHDFSNLLSQVSDGDSVDSYYTCRCGDVMHVYTYAPGGIRHENIHESTSWTAGFAHGLARGSKAA